MPNEQIQWQTSPKAVTSPVSVPMFKVWGVHVFFQNCRAIQGAGLHIQYNSWGQMLQGMESCGGASVSDTEIYKWLCFQES